MAPMRGLLSLMSTAYSAQLSMSTKAAQTSTQCLDDACHADGTSGAHFGIDLSTDSVLLQTRHSSALQKATQGSSNAWDVKTHSIQSFCHVNATVRCPGSSDVWCFGTECCPGENGGPNFPCPSAPAGWGQGQCESTEKRYDCTKGWQCKADDTVQCPGSGVWCHGEECCPGVSGGPTFPCPSAPPGWGEGQCQTTKRDYDCMPEGQCQVGETVWCPGIGNEQTACAGKECCPGVDGANFPCPSAPPGWGEGECEVPTKQYNCAKGWECLVGAPVQCPGSGQWCAGEECCPGAEGEPNFPCPSAPADWGVGQCQEPAKKWDCTTILAL